jgi:hypothetical protein
VAAAQQENEPAKPSAVVVDPVQQENEPVRLGAVVVDPTLDLQFVPIKSSILKGTPPQSTTSQITMGVVGTDVDNFLSPTGSNNVSYTGGFGYFGFDMNSLSVGVSRKFRGALTSLYYSGNIIEDMFAYIANKPNASNASIEAFEGLTGTEYELLGELNGKNNIDSRTTVNALFALGKFGINLGFSQTLIGYVNADPSNPERDGTSNNATISLGKKALLDDSMAPSIELGITLGQTEKVIVRTTFTGVVDIHSYRDFKSGQVLMIKDFFTDDESYTLTKEENVLEKTLADYLEPAGLLRFEFEFPTDERSRAALAIEGGFRTKLYSNINDKGETISGTYYSRKIGDNGANGFDYSITNILDIGFLARPSVRYITAMTNRLRVGLNGAIGLDMNFGKEIEKSYRYASYTDFLAYSDSVPNSVITRLIGIDMGIKPLLGIGATFDVVPDQFRVTAGAGGEQTLYRFSVGTEKKVIAGEEVEAPIAAQEWGKPEAQLALGATFMFGKGEKSGRYTLDAMFSSNGIDLEKSNFVVQFSARF